MRRLILNATIVFIATAAQAQGLTVKMFEALPTGQGKVLGTIAISQTPDGLKFTPALTGIKVGEHGFHVHQNGSCAPGEEDGKTVPAHAAGGHYDPAETKSHHGPEGDGHLGDLPLLRADADGKIETSVVAPHLKSLDEIKGRSLMIHVGGDNYSDEPKPLGGGGARLACGVIE
ncbi:superoxide dismutase [Cu-Zn] SodC [Brucella sp. BE17]|uniref:superoxide dismutase [Cu-Zn] SodC n=1 Tax=Brucella sp. BE17 TaxID=3142977 RepID=UPI0031BB3EB4